MTLSMDANTFALYVHEMRNQCIYAETAINLFNQALEKNSKTGAFFAVQCFLTSAAQLSRMLWPVRAKAKRRGEFLRQALQLPEKHPLADDRLRNLWDLADEKTDDWIQGSKNQIIAVDFVGPLQEMGDKKPKDEHIYRLYDPSNHYFYFRGDIFNLQSLARQVAEVTARVNGAHDQLFPKKKEDEAGDSSTESSSTSDTTAQPEAANSDNESVS